MDQLDPRAKSVALDLKDIDKYEFYAGFLKSSAKITLIPKPMRRSAFQNRFSSQSPTNESQSSHHQRNSTSETSSGPHGQTTATWVCSICSFSNPVPTNFDPAAANAHTPLPPCLACGIKPTLPQLLKASISNATNHHASSQGNMLQQKDQRSQAPNPPAGGMTAESDVRGGSSTTFRCPRCTFSNHPSLLSCEMCGASLLRTASFPAQTRATADNGRTNSPGPVLDTSTNASFTSPDASEGIKISFRGGGEKIFYERLKGSMTQRKWLLQNAPPPPKGRRDEGNTQNDSPETSNSRPKTAGIAGLEQLRLNMHKNNEMLIGSAFEDLEALMASAKEVVALAEKFARQNSRGTSEFSAEENAILAESASQLGLVTTKDMVGGGSSESLYLSELSRNVAEFLSDDSRGVLKRAGGILTLVDLWAMFNRARGGVELVSPNDFERAARLWENLKLPVRLRTFRSGVMVVQGSDRTDETTIKALLSWFQDLHEFPPDKKVAWDWQQFGRGVTAHEAAERFGWSLGVAEEELLMAEERGVLCREEGLEGLKFWENFIGTSSKSHKKIEEDPLLARFRSAGLI